MHDLAQFFMIMSGGWQFEASCCVDCTLCVMIIANFSYEFDTNERNSTKQHNFLGKVFSD